DRKTVLVVPDIIDLVRGKCCDEEMRYPLSLQAVDPRLAEPLHTLVTGAERILALTRPHADRHELARARREQRRSGNELPGTVRAIVVVKTPMPAPVDVDIHDAVGEAVARQRIREIDPGIGDRSLCDVLPQPPPRLN